MYELNGKEVTLEFLQGKAQEYGMDIDSYLETMKKKGLVEKTNGSQAEDATAESKDTASESEDTSWGSQLYNNFQAYVNPFVSASDKALYKAGVDPEELQEKVRKESAAYKDQMQDFNKELDKAFGDNPTLFGKIIENPQGLTLQEREIKAGEFGDPTKYLLEILKKQIGKQTKGSKIVFDKFDTQEVEAPIKYSLKDQEKYPSLTFDDIDKAVEQKFYNKLEEYKTNKGYEKAIESKNNIEAQGQDISNWYTNSRRLFVNAYEGINKEIAALVENINHGNLKGEQLNLAILELEKKKAQKGDDGTTMFFDLKTGQTTIARDEDSGEGKVPLGVKEKQAEWIDELDRQEPENKLGFLKNEFERASLQLANINTDLNEVMEWSVRKSGYEITAEKGQKGNRKIIRMTLREALQRNAELSDQGIVPVSEIQGLDEGQRKDLVDKWQKKFKVYEEDQVEYTGEFEALKGMYLLNEGLEDIQAPEYLPISIIPKNMAALKQSGANLVKPWAGDYFTNQLFGSTARELLTDAGEVYDNLGIKKTKEEEEQLKTSLNEMVNDGLLQSNKLLIEFGAINKGMQVLGAAQKFAGLMQALSKGKYVKNGKIVTEAAVKARARAKGLSVDNYVKSLGGRLKATEGGFAGMRFIKATNTDKGLAVLANGLMEGVKFEAFTQFDVTKLKLKPEAGEEFGFSTGFGFGAAGRLLTPLSPLLSRKGLLPDIDKAIRIGGREARIGANSRKLFETFVTQPASFVAGSEGGEIVDKIVDDALEIDSYKNWIEEHYGHHDEVGKRLITNYFVGLGFGVGHFKGFADFKSKAALRRTRNIELNRMREFGRLAKLSTGELNNLFRPEAQNKIHENLSDANLKKFYDSYEIYDAMTTRIHNLYRAEGYLDPNRAEELVRDDHKQFIAEEKAAGREVRFEVVNNDRLKFGQTAMDPLKNADISKQAGTNITTIRYNAKRYTPDVMAHEVHHYYTEELLGKDAVFKADFMNTLNSIAGKIKLQRLVTEAEAKELGNESRSGQEMNLSEAIKLEKFDLTNPRRNTKISQWELFAHIAEQLGNRNNYLNVKNSNGFSDLKSLLSSLAKPTGKKLNLSKEADVVRWFAEYASNVKKGKSVVDLFAELNSVVDKDAIKINRELDIVEQPGSTRLSSRDLLKEKAELIEQNKELAKTKPEGYLQLAKENAEKVKAINENIRVSEANKKNIKTFKELEPGDPARTRAENELLKDNAPIIETWFRKNFKKGLDVSESDFRGSMYEQVAKIMKSYNDFNVPFGYYMKSRLAPQLGNILRRAQAGRTTEIAMSEVGVDAETLQITDASTSSGIVEGAKAYRSKGRRLVNDLNVPEDIVNKIEKSLETLNLDKLTYKTLKDLAPEFANGLLGVTPKPGNLNKGSVENAQKWFNKDSNIKLFLDILPEGTVPMKGAPEGVKGTSTGVQNVLLDAFYVKGERTKTKQGVAVQVKRNDITNRQVQEFFGIKPDGTFVELKNDRGLSQKVKSAVDQIGKALTNQVVRNTLESRENMQMISNRIEAGKSEALASKILDSFMERFPENTFEQASEKFYRAYLNDRSKLTTEEQVYFDNVGLTDGIKTREAALLFGYAEAKGKAGKAEQKGFDKDIIDADIKPVSTADGKVITPAEIKGLDLSANFSKYKGNVLVNVPRTNRFVDHSVEFSKLLPKEIAQNLSFLDQILFLHQRTTFEREGRYAKFAPAIDAITGKKVRQIEGEFEGFIMDSRDGSPIVEQPFTRGRERALEVLGENTLSEIWEGVGFEFNKAESQVTGQKNYVKAKTNTERIAVVEKYFNSLSETTKAKVYDGIASTMEAYVHSGKTKAEVLSRMEWAANAMRSNSDLRLGLRQTAPILAIYKGKGKMTDVKFKLEHLKTSKKQSSTAFELIAQNKWRQFGPETLKDFVGVLSPKKLLDIIDAKGGKVNAEALYRMALLEPNTLKEFVTVESKGKENLLDYVLRTVKSNLNAKAVREATLQEMMYKSEVKQVQDVIGKKYQPQGKVLNSKNLNNIDNALIEGRKRNKNPRGMSTFDFDETLIIGGKNFVTATKGKESIRISSEQFPLKGPELAEQGYKFDFKDFVNVKGGKEGPLMQKLKNQIEKYGTDNVFVLTARMQEAAPAIHAWLKSKGVELKLENITGLGNSTGEAKALWMLEKFSEGYNDMYFVDDALPNVKAVKSVLNQLDIKSNVQQALASVDLNKGVNDIMQHSLGIQSNKVFSKAEGKVRGKDIKRRRFFMPDTASDLELLLEPLYGKGEKGTENKKWFQENFVRKWERGINDFNNARQTITNDYMSLRKKNKDVVKQLPEAVEGTNFTHDQAIRIYIWNKNGYKIPDLTPTTQQKLVKYVVSNPKYKSYADNLARLTKVEGGLKEPSSEWWAETIATEIKGLGEGIGRKKYIQDFIESKNEIFSEANLNKMESKLGGNWRETIEDMFDRMETGRTRSMKLGKTGTAIMNYLNGSTGAIMNFNTRSAALQLISTVNFVNSSFNNPLRAGQAFANQPQYWKDFMFIMNSDMLKQRRQGLEINVSEAELASAASQSKSPAKAALAKILKAGYLPTKIADSFAIAAGGATFYRNAIKKYTREGLSKAEAEKKAFIDFQAIAERTQQSSRADLLSKQQTSLEGRFILPFANTPMQMNRIMIKDILDLSKGRYKGFYGENSLTSKLSRIGYYGFVQSAIFAGLQSGAFALMTNSDDDKKIAESKLNSLNTVADSFLRGMGIQGAVVNGVRLAIQEFIKQDGKKYNADYSEVAEKLLNISPTIGSKFSKLDAAGNTYDYNKKLIKQEGLTLNGPLLEASTQVIEATTNVPLNRYYKKGNNIQNALDDSYYNWQRVLSASGWNVWGLGEGKDESRIRIKNKGKETEYTKYLTKEGLRREQVLKEIKKKESQAKEQRCIARTSSGRRCKNMANKPKTRCYAHD